MRTINLRNTTCLQTEPSCSWKTSLKWINKNHLNWSVSKKVWSSLWLTMKSTLLKLKKLHVVIPITSSFRKKDKLNQLKHTVKNNKLLNLLKKIVSYIKMKLQSVSPWKKKRRRMNLMFKIILTILNKHWEQLMKKKKTTRNLKREEVLMRALLEEVLELKIISHRVLSELRLFQACKMILRQSMCRLLQINKNHQNINHLFKSNLNMNPPNKCLQREILLSQLSKNQLKNKCQRKKFLL